MPMYGNMLHIETYTCWPRSTSQHNIFFNTLRPRQHERHLGDDTLKSIFLNENVIILIKISLKFVPKGPSNNIPALVQIMAWRWLGDKPLSEAMMVSLLMHICVTRPQWVNQHHVFCITIAGIIMCMSPANERWYHNIASYHIGWVHVQKYPCHCNEAWYYIIYFAWSKEYYYGHAITGSYRAARIPHASSRLKGNIKGSAYRCGQWEKASRNNTSSYWLTYP